MSLSDSEEGYSPISQTPLSQTQKEDEPQISYYEAFSKKLPEISTGSSGHDQGGTAEGFTNRVPPYAIQHTVDYHALGSRVINNPEIMPRLKGNKISWQLPYIRFDYEQDVRNAYDASPARVIHCAFELWLRQRQKSEVFRFGTEVPSSNSGSRTRTDGSYKVEGSDIASKRCISVIEYKRSGWLSRKGFRYAFRKSEDGRTSFKHKVGKVTYQGQGYLKDQFTRKIVYHDGRTTVFVKYPNARKVPNRDPTTKTKYPYTWHIPLNDPCEMSIFDDQDPRLVTYWLGWLVEDESDLILESRAAASSGSDKDNNDNNKHDRHLSNMPSNNLVIGRGRPTAAQIQDGDRHQTQSIASGSASRHQSGIPIPTGTEGSRERGLLSHNPTLQSKDPGTATRHARNGGAAHQDSSAGPSAALTETGRDSTASRRGHPINPHGVRSDQPQNISGRAKANSERYERAERRAKTQEETAEAGRKASQKGSKDSEKDEKKKHQK